VAWPGAARGRPPSLPPPRRRSRPRGRFPARLFVFALLPFVVLGLIWLGNSAYYAWTKIVPTAGGRYVEAFVGQPNTLNPLLAQLDPVDREFLPLLFAGLTRATPDGQIVPDLAERWDVSPDGRSYTFVLRGGLRWSDGTPLDAHDVAFTYDALRTPDFPADPDFLAPWREVQAEALDARTVRCSLSRPWAGFLDAATLPIVPRQLLSGTSGRAWLDQPFNYHPVGAGPYRLQDLNAQEMVLVPNAQYHGARPNLAELRFQFLLTSNTARDALAAGEADGALLRATDLATLRANPDLAIYQHPDYTRTTMLWLNTTAPPFDDKAVRVAAALALDRSRLAAEADAAAEPAVGPLPPASWAYATDTAFPTYAPDRARALLDGAGWRAGPNGERTRGGSAQGTPLAVTLLTNENPTRRRTAEGVARDLRAVGFRVQVALRDWAELAREDLAPRSFQAVVLGQWQPATDPDALHDVWQSDGVGNLAGWQNPRADELLARGAATLEPTERRAAYAAFQALWADEMPSVPLYYPALAWAVRTTYQGVSLAPLVDTSQRLALLPSWYLYTARVFRGWP
jgi:peptide/nickel transport system substrate-binding protein